MLLLLPLIKRSRQSMHYSNNLANDACWLAGWLAGLIKMLLRCCKVNTAEVGVLNKDDLNDLMLFDSLNQLCTFDPVDEC